MAFSAHKFRIEAVSWSNRRQVSSMLTEIYIEALLVDVEKADAVWEAWAAEEISDAKAMGACCRSQHPVGILKRGLARDPLIALIA